jgi:hypothetical protein
MKKRFWWGSEEKWDHMEGACVHGSIQWKWMGGMEWINLAEYRDKSYTTVCMVMHVTSSIQYRPITCYEGPEGEVKYSSTLSLTSTLDWGSLQPTHQMLHSQQWPGYRWTEGCASPRAGLEWCGKIVPTGIRSPNRPARSKSVYRLSSPGTPSSYIFRKFFLTYRLLVSQILCSVDFSRRSHSDILGF